MNLVGKNKNGGSLTDFWSKVDKDGPIHPVLGRCWVWIGPKFSGKEYGQFGALGERRAHRISYKIKFGEIPEGMMVLHKCDIGSCVNPDHLFVGTHKDKYEGYEKQIAPGLR